MREVATRKSRGLVSYDKQPTVIRSFFQILPETEVEEPRKRAKKRKGD